MYTFPERSELTIPEPVKQALLNHLLIPFQSLSEAKVFWQENSVQLIFSEPPGDAVPEYTDPLPEGYSISLVIISDASDGVYYVSATQPRS